MFISAPPIKIDVAKKSKDLLKDLLQAINTISEVTEIPVVIEDILTEENTIKHSELEAKLKCVFKLSDHRDATFTISVPKYDRVVSIKSVRRYIQKQIRDTLFITPVPNISKTIIANHIYTYIDYTIELTRFSIPLVPLYEFYLQEEGIEESKLRKHIEEDDKLKKEYEKLKNVRNLQTYIRNYVSEQKFKRFYYTTKILFEIYKDLLYEYVDSKADLFYKMYLLAKRGIKIGQDDHKGLNLIHRRVRDQYSIIFDSYISAITHELLYTLTSKKKKFNFNIEAGKYLYDFVLMEQFISPLSTVADLNRCTIIGEGGYQRDNIPASVRDIHPTHYMNLDPCVTPDRDNAGVVLYLATNVPLDKYGRFIDLLDKEKEYFNEIFGE